jgi:hypothetical protein
MADVDSSTSCVATAAPTMEPTAAPTPDYQLFVTGTDYQLFVTGSECAVGSNKKQGAQLYKTGTGQFVDSSYMSFAECAAAACDSSGNCAQWIEFGTFGQGGEEGDRCIGNDDNCKCYEVTGGCSDQIEHDGYNIFALTAPATTAPPAAAGECQDFSTDKNAKSGENIYLDR